MPVIAAAIIGGVATAASGALSAQSQGSANQRNVDLARETSATQIELANTAHQREVADLKAAGLNPVLSAKFGGAAVPNIPTAQVAPIEYPDVGRGVSSAAMAKAQMALLKEQTMAAHEDYLTKAENTEMVARANAWDNLKTGFMLSEGQLDKVEAGWGAELDANLLRGRQAQQSIDTGVQNLSNMRQQLANMIREYNIGGSAEAQSKILEGVYKSSPGEVLKYLELLRQFVPWSRR